MTQGIILKQKIMRRVLISLVPIMAFSWYLFGSRVFLLLLISNTAAFCVEYIMARSIDKKSFKVSEAVFVTGTLYTLTLPPDIPVWTALVGIIFGVFFGKMVFGGFGKNIFNPALAGRCFIYVSFPGYMTGNWILPFQGFPGGLLKYADPDAVTSVTPLVSNDPSRNGFGLLELFFGTIPGSIGETSVLLIACAGIYLALTKTASWKIMISTLCGFVLPVTVLYAAGVIKTDPVYSLMTGGILFAAVFMATDPVSAPRHEPSKLIYGLLAGAVAAVIRTFSIFAEGAMFAILIANTFAPFIDRHIGAKRTAKKVSA